MVEPQQPPEALTAPHWTGLADLLVRKEEEVVFSLVSNAGQYFPSRS